MKKQIMHTPGPWHTSPHGDLHRAGVYAGKPNEIIICDVTDEDLPKDLEFEANCKLIAAAPDLLAALEAMLSSPKTGDTPSEAAVKLARKAVKKARMVI